MASPKAIGASALLLAGLLTLWSAPLAAEQHKRLDQVERALAVDQAKAKELKTRARSLRVEIESLQRAMVAAAKLAQDLEDELSTKEASLIELEVRRADTLAALKNRHAQLSRTLGALQRIALTPPEAALAAPGLPIDTTRSALLLGVAIPGIERRATGLRRDLAALEALRTAIQEERRDIAAATRELNGKQKHLSSLIEQKRGLEDVTEAEQRAARARVRKLAREAKNLRDFMAKLEQEARQRRDRQEQQERLAAEQQAAEQAAAETAVPDAPEREVRPETAPPQETQQALLSPPAAQLPLERPSNVRPFPDSPSAATLVMPARGRMIVTYGERKAGEATVSKGLSIKTRSFAQVVAPYDGRVVYAGEFRGYGQILIIEHGGRYHTLLAGLDRIDAVAGQWLLAGEPVGMMGRVESGDSMLYLELRRTGQPINPLPWLATTNDKVQG